MPQDILKSDVFFFVTTIAVVVVTAIYLIAGIYMIKVLRDIRFLMRSLRTRYGLLKRIIKTITRLK